MKQERIEFIENLGKRARNAQTTCAARIVFFALAFLSEELTEEQLIELKRIGPEQFFDKYLSKMLTA